MRRLLRRGRTGPDGGKREMPLPAVDYLRRVNLFQNLTMEEIEPLFKGVMVRECNPGMVFFAPDDSSERLFILKAGQVELYRLTPSGKRLVIRRVGPGSIFGEMGLLGQSMQECFAEAVESSLVCTATQEDILRLFQQRPDIALRLLEIVGNRLKLLEERLEQATFSPVKVRLVGFLLANVNPSTGVVADYTHAEIGDTIGALRQTVTETLSELQEQGLVEVGHKQIRLKDREALEGLLVEK